jgi:hypothetical protein
MKKTALLILPVLVSFTMFFASCGGDDPVPPPTIGVPTVTGLFQPEGQVTITFTSTGTFGAGNVFTAQLSDGNGSFTNPTAIGTLNATTAGTITATLPASIVNGTGFRVRVVANTPATTGPDNGSNLTIAAPTISVTNVTTTGTFNRGAAISVSTTLTGTFAACNGFTLQLSNANGEFTSPVSLGTNTGTTLNATSQAFLPNNVVAGTGYRVRWVSTCPVVTGTPSNAFEVRVQTLGVPTVTGNLVPGGAIRVQVPYSNGSWSSGNTIRIELSDASGSFASPVILNSLPTTLGASGTQLLTANLPVSTPVGSSYRIRANTSTPFATSENSTSFAVGAIPTLTLSVVSPVFTKMYSGLRFPSVYIFRITRTGEINSLNDLRLEMSPANQPFGSVAASLALNATQVNELVGIGSTNVVYGLQGVGNGVRRFRVNATTHPGVVSPDLTFDVTQTGISSFTGSVENTAFTFSGGNAFYNTNFANQVNHQILYSMGESPTTLYGAVTLRAFIGFNLVNQNIQTGTQTAAIIFHFLDGAGQQIGTFSSPATISVSGTPGAYTATASNVSVSRTFGNLGNATLTVQSLSCLFSMQ